jgi:4-diphosphocytidyl-2-C-methyl-D-erythritol kinase
MRIFSPAKINLFLQVTSKRSDGYHNLLSLMCRISLYDKITLRFGGAKTKISCTDPQVPENEKNIAYLAANLFLRKLNKNDGVKIDIEKNIPVAAGLGGGSSNAASVLMALNRYYGYPLSENFLIKMGSSLGADVPFFIFQKPALASGIGDKLEDFAALEPYHIVLIYPGFKVSTAEVYQNLNLGLTKCKKEITYALLKKSGFQAQLHLCNDLESVTISRFPEIADVKQLLMEQGAEGALMSGSGPSVFGLFTDYDAARKAKAALSRHTRWRLFLVDLLINAVNLFED